MIQARGPRKKIDGVLVVFFEETPNMYQNGVFWLPAIRKPPAKPREKNRGKKNAGKKKTAGKKPREKKSSGEQLVTYMSSA